MRIKIIILFFSIYSCGSSQEKKEVIELSPSFWTNEEHKLEVVENVVLYFGVGFDNYNYIDVSLNETLLKRVECNTNYSIGFCVDKKNEIVNISIPISKIQNQNTLILETKTEIVKIKVGDKMKNYNKLVIQKEGKKWNAAFENSSETFLVE